MTRKTDYIAHTSKYLDDVFRPARQGGLGHASHYIPVQCITVDGTTPPTAATVGTSAQSQLRVLQFDDTTSDDVYVQWMAPNDFGGELRIEVPWSCTDNTTTTNVVWAADVRAISTNGGAVDDAAGTALTAVGQALDATASQVQKATLNASAVAITPGQAVKIHLWRDHDHTAGGSAGVADDATADAVLEGGVNLTYRRK